jgi:DNA (cytosine-5)-methyltransferase 1
MLDGTLEKDNRVYDMSGIAATVTCGSSSVQGKYLDIRESAKGKYEMDGKKYDIRVRKLNPIECWRIMGFSDEDYHKAEKVNSLVQLQKQAGNSIVVTCLMAIFSQMNIQGVDKWNDMTEKDIYKVLTNC